MNPDQQEDSLKESMGQVMQSLPPFIQKYLSEGKYTAVAQSLMSKYKLRIDQGGILERELLLLLMGIENPAEFSQALTEEAKIGPEIMTGLIQDINEQVFAPLRKQEEDMVKASKLPQSNVPAVRPAMPAVPAARPKVVVFNQGGVQKPVATPAPAHIAPLPPKTVMPVAGGSLHDAVRAALASNSQKEKLMLEDHEEPHIDITVARLAQKAPVVPTRTMPAAPVAPVPTAVPTPTPAISAVPTSPIASRPVSPATPGIPQISKTPPQPITSYSADPYREPIDEH